MIANVSKNNTGKLLVTVLAMAMIVAGAAVVFSDSVNAADAPEPTLSEDGTTVTFVDGDDSTYLTQIIKGMAGDETYSEYAKVTTIYLGAGKYNVDADMTLTDDVYTGAAQADWVFPIVKDGVTISGKGATTILTTTNSDPNGAWATQNYITVFGDNVTIQGVNIVGKDSGANKHVEVVGTNFTLKDSILGKEGQTAGSLIVNNGFQYSTDVAGVGSNTVTIDNVTFNDSFLSASYTDNADITVVDSTFNVTNENGSAMYNSQKDNPSSNVTFNASNVTVNVEYAQFDLNDYLDQAVSGMTFNIDTAINATEGFTIKQGVTLNLNQPVSTTGDVILEGRLAGTAALSVTGESTLEIIPGASYNTSNISEGTKVTGSTTWQDVILQGSYDSYLDGKANQKVTVVDDLVIGSNAQIIIKGQFIVNEGATVTIESGAKITIESGATVQIDGDVTIEGSATADATFKFNGKSMTVNGAVTLDGANSYSCDAASEVTINGIFEIGEEATANFGKVTIANGGELVIYGLASGNVLNNGIVTINTMGVPGNQGYFNNDFNVQMGNGAVLDGISIVGTIKVTDSDLMFRTNGQNYPAKYDNTIELKDVAGIVITEKMEIKTDAETEERYGDNSMVITGNIVGSSHIETITQNAASAITISGKDGKGQVVIDEDVSMTDVKLTVNSGSELIVNGNLTMTKTAGSTTTSAPLAGEGVIYVSGAQITVKGSITSNTAIDGTTVNAAMYTDVNPVMYHYTTLEAALASGATKITVTGTIDVTADATIPVGTTVDARSATVNIDENATLTVAAQDRDSGKLQNDNGTINVEGILVVENLDRSNVNANNVVSDTSSTAGNSVTFTNIYNALENAQDGETVEITKTGDQTVTLDRNVEVKTGVTLEIPAGKTVIVDNAVTLTVNGTVYVNGGTLTINPDSATADVKDDAAVVTINGMLKSVASTDIYQSVIAGAYFGYDNLNVIAPLAIAAGLVNDIETTQIALYLENEVADVAFDYTGSDVITLVNNGKLTAGSIDLGALVFEASAGTSTTATIVLTNGTVDLDNVNGITVRDVVTYDDNNNPVFTATVSGNVAAFDNAETEDVVESGTVTIGGAVTSGATYKAEDTTAKTGAVSVVVPADATFTTTGGYIADITVAGTLTATGTTNAGIVSVTGIIGVDEASLNITTLYAGVTAEKKVVDDTTRYILTVGAGTAVIGEGVSVTGVAYVAPGTEIAETITGATKVTEYYVDDSLFVTAYAADNSTQIGAIEAPAEHAKFIKWMNADEEDASSKTIGATDFTEVYADIEYNIFEIDVSACPGVTVYIDSKMWEPYRENFSGTLYAYGSHTITVYVSPNYEGTPEIVINGQTVTGDSFTLSGDTEIVVTGVTASTGSGQIVVNNGSDDMSLTDILLIVLVVLIVIMAIIVALRLMRS